MSSKDKKAPKEEKKDKDQDKKKKRDLKVESVDNPGSTSAFSM